MASFETKIPSGWTADETFSYLAMFSNAKDWDPGVLDAERIDTGQVRAGSRFRLIVPFGRRRLALMYEVVSISSENREVRLVARNALLRVSDQIVVRSATPPEEGAEVAYRAQASLRGPFRLLDLLLSRDFHRVGERAAAGLAAALATPWPAGAVQAP
jgi:hypothetical protein